MRRLILLLRSAARAARAEAIGLLVMCRCHRGGHLLGADSVQVEVLGGSRGEPLRGSNGPQHVRNRLRAFPERVVTQLVTQSR